MSVIIYQPNAFKAPVPVRYAIYLPACVVKCLQNGSGFIVFTNVKNTLTDLTVHVVSGSTVYFLVQLSVVWATDHLLVEII